MWIIEASPQSPTISPRDFELPDRLRPGNNRSDQLVSEDEARQIEAYLFGEGATEIDKKVSMAPRQKLYSFGLGLSYKEIAELTGSPFNTVCTSIHRCRKALKPFRKSLDN